MAGLSAIKIKTILLDTFIELLVDEVNKLKNNEIKDILNDEIDVILPESEDIKVENYSNKGFKTLRCRNNCALI